MDSGILLLIILVAYFAVLLLIGRFSRGKSDDNSNSNFFLAGKSSPWWLVAIGMVGTSISGVTFVSVPGIPLTIDMTYMQTVLGFFVGYIVIAKLLLPLYYRLNLISIYTYLGKRFGNRAYKTGAAFFIISKIIGAAARLYIVVLILQSIVLAGWNVPFWLTASTVVLLIWLYSRRSGMRTIVRTDALQTLFMVGALVLILVQVTARMHLNVSDAVDMVRQSGHDRIFVFDDWRSTQNFFKQFFSGIFITIVMSGLDQDIMQKNLSIRSLREAQKNMYIYGAAFIPVNLLFLVLGILLIVFAGQEDIAIPAKTDELFGIRRVAAVQYRHRGGCVFECRLGAYRPDDFRVRRYARHRPVEREKGGAGAQRRAYSRLHTVRMYHVRYRDAQRYERHRCHLHDCRLHLRSAARTVCLRTFHAGHSARPLYSFCGCAFAAPVLRLAVVAHGGIRLPARIRTSDTQRVDNIRRLDAALCRAFPKTEHRVEETTILIKYL